MPNEYSTFSPDDLEAILGMGDFGAREKALARQQAMASELRGMGNQPSSGRHWTRQLGRGLQGVAGAVAGYKADQAETGLSADRTKFIRDLIMRRRGGGAAPAPMAVDPNYKDPFALEDTGLGTYTG